jgi:hypothetical protein
LISALFPKSQTTRLISGRKRFHAVGFDLTRSSSAKASISATLMGISRQARMTCVAATVPALFSLTPAFRPVYNPHSSQ